MRVWPAFTSTLWSVLFTPNVFTKKLSSKLKSQNFVFAISQLFFYKSRNSNSWELTENSVYTLLRGDFFFNCKALILETVKKFGSNLITTTPNFIWFATKYKVCVLLLYFYRKVQGFLKIILNVFRCIWACTRKDRQSWVSLFFEISEFQISEFCVLSK